MRTAPIPETRHMVVMEEEDVGENNKWPPWLRPLLSTRFFVQCKLHRDSPKSDCNMYCLDCVGTALCSLCLNYHRDHRVIQIRRSSYHDVIRVSEIQKVLDITEVQTYVINSARVVFLNERPQQRSGGKGANNACEVCERTLLDSFRFCSLGCKIAGTSDGVSRKNKKRSVASIADTEGSCTSPTHGAGRNLRFSTQPSLSENAMSYRRNGKRRKGIPRRAPFGSLLLWY